MKICLSIAPRSTAEALRSLRNAGASADLVEVRIDGIVDLNLPQLLRKPRPKLIVTNRRASEGGNYNGTGDEQVRILTEAACLGAEYVDIEFSWGKHAIRRLLSGANDAKVIVSYHNFEHTAARLPALARNMKAAGADVIKIATMAKSIEDASSIFKLMQDIRKNGRTPTIALCMGERGEVSRILGGKFGGFLTFGSADRSSVTAPGQRTVDELKNIFRSDTLTSRTKVFGLVGNPVAHSSGIYFHNDVFSRRSADAVYVNFLVDNLATFIKRFSGMLAGLSVTMPFKQDILEYLDRVQPDAEALHAVNTVIVRRNKLHGYNTDLPAIEKLLRRKITLSGKKVLILGTGGTAATMAFASRRNGAQVTLVGRSLASARKLAARFGCGALTYDTLSDVSCDVLINATPVGMDQAGYRIPSTFLPSGLLRKRMLVFDAVYNPPITKLLRKATASGCETISGADLFKEQALLQSRLFLKSIS
ncbi:MAG TPA: type I 3-dehydroquinate dehydratase [Bacteroidota bacterium]|nr:type I 3-dehydroquinate dehydratase [Bacteroidota bacterium]